MQRVKKIYYAIIRFAVEVGADHVSAYAAQSAFFFFLSVIPLILLLITLVQYTSVTQSDIMRAVLQVFPSSITSLINSIIDEVYRSSGSVIPLTIIVALWSAGRGVLAISSGLNCVYRCNESRNYFYLRGRASIYTVIFIIVIILLLVLTVFGNSLYYLINIHIPILAKPAKFFLNQRLIITFPILILFHLLVYRFLPDRKIKVILKRQLPGAVFAAASWMFVSYIFSIYLELFTGFSSMYGSFTTIILIMLWLYFSMYGILIGGKINVVFRRWMESHGR